MTFRGRSLRWHGDYRYWECNWQRPRSRAGECDRRGHTGSRAGLWEGSGRSGSRALPALQCRRSGSDRFGARKDQFNLELRRASGELSSSGAAGPISALGPDDCKNAGDRRKAGRSQRRHRLYREHGNGGRETFLWEMPASCRSRDSMLRVASPRSVRPSP